MAERIPLSLLEITYAKGLGRPDFSKRRLKGLAVVYDGVRLPSFVCDRPRFVILSLDSLGENRYSEDHDVLRFTTQRPTPPKLSRVLGYRLAVSLLPGH